MSELSHGSRAEFAWVSHHRGRGWIVRQHAEDFRGWDGTRTWENYDGRTASVAVEVEAGAELSALARGLSVFFTI